jgi:hypothetical protein
LAERFRYEVDIASELVMAHERRPKRATEGCKTALSTRSRR